MNGYVWTTNAFESIPAFIVVALARSPREAVDKIIEKFRRASAFSESQLDRMRNDLSGASPQILDLSDDVGYVTTELAAVFLPLPRA
jgi:hypothetical protein